MTRTMELLTRIEAVLCPICHVHLVTLVLISDTDIGVTPRYATLCYQLCCVEGNYQDTQNVFSSESL